MAHFVSNGFNLRRFRSRLDSFILVSVIACFPIFLFPGLPGLAHRDPTNFVDQVPESSALGKIGIYKCNVCFEIFLFPLVAARTNEHAKKHLQRYIECIQSTES